ncbi:hypothetical protein NBRC116493_15500 [Aurantivibrio infirmus]
MDAEESATAKDGGSADFAWSKKSAQDELQRVLRTRPSHQNRNAALATITKVVFKNS